MALKEELEAHAKELAERRKQWADGEWNREPDRVEFKHAGLDCLLIRSVWGVWCGYAGVPKTHPLYGKGYNDVDVGVHGGLTYADECSGHICHSPNETALTLPEKDEVWWFGFDCNHMMDFSPGMEVADRFLHDKHPEMKAAWERIRPEKIYRNLEYATAEVKNLAEQLVGV